MYTIEPTHKQILVFYIPSSYELLYLLITRNCANYNRYIFHHSHTPYSDPCVTFFCIVYPYPLDIVHVSLVIMTLRAKSTDL